MENPVSENMDLTPLFTHICERPPLLPYVRRNDELCCFTVDRLNLQNRALFVHCRTTPCRSLESATARRAPCWVTRPDTSWFSLRSRDWYVHAHEGGFALRLFANRQDQGPTAFLRPLAEESCGTAA